jgi:hypothetical protein
MKNKIEIKLQNGKWLINGKRYQVLYKEEKLFFDKFLIAMKISPKSILDHASY